MHSWMGCKSFAGINKHGWRRGRVECLDQGHNTMTLPQVLDLESCAPINGHPSITATVFAPGKLSIHSLLF